MPKRLKHIYEEICAFENLYAAYLEARKSKRYRDDVLEFTSNLEENIWDLHYELSNKTYKEGPYKQFYVYYPRKRLIMALPFRDRVVQWAFYRVLNPHFTSTYITDSHACINGRGAQSAIARVQYWLRKEQNPKKANSEKLYYLKLDMQSFYHRIPHSTIIKYMGKEISDPDVMWYIAQNLNGDTPFGIPLGKKADEVPVSERLFDVGIPIGSLMSQLESNVVCNPLDQYAKRTLGIKYWIRYMDDILIIHNSKAQLHEWKKLIEKFVNDELGLTLNPKKTVLQPVSLGIEFVGYRIWNTHIKIRKSTALRMKHRLRKVKKDYADGKLEIDDIRSTTASYYGMLKHCDSYSLRSKLSEDFVLVRKSSAE